MSKKYCIVAAILGCIFNNASAMEEKKPYWSEEQIEEFKKLADYNKILEEKKILSDEIKYQPNGSIIWIKGEEKILCNGTINWKKEELEKLEKSPTLNLELEHYKKFVSALKQHIKPKVVYSEWEDETPLKQYKHITTIKQLLKEYDLHSDSDSEDDKKSRENDEILKKHNVSSDSENSEGECEKFLEKNDQFFDKLEYNLGTCIEKHTEEEVNEEISNINKSFNKIENNIKSIIDDMKDKKKKILEKLTKEELEEYNKQYNIFIQKFWSLSEEKERTQLLREFAKNLRKSGLIKKNNEKN